MQALDDTYVDDEDSTLDGDGVTLEFTLPAGVIDIKEVWIENQTTKIRTIDHLTTSKRTAYYVLITDTRPKMAG